MPKLRFPKTVGYPKHIFTVFLVVKYDYKAVCEWFFLWLSAIHSFVKNKKMRFVINGVFLVGFNDKIHHGIGFKRLAFLQFPFGF